MPERMQEPLAIGIAPDRCVSGRWRFCAGDTAWLLRSWLIASANRCRCLYTVLRYRRSPVSSSMITFPSRSVIEEDLLDIQNGCGFVRIVGIVIPVRLCRRSWRSRGSIRRYPPFRPPHSSLSVISCCSAGCPPALAEQAAKPIKRGRRSPRNPPSDGSEDPRRQPYDRNIAAGAECSRVVCRHDLRSVRAASGGFSGASIIYPMPRTVWISFCWKRSSILLRK